MNWNDIQHFLAVAASGGLPAAARDLGVSQVTAWRHVRRLEETLKVRLFEERKGGYIVSPAGQRLLELARRIDHDLSDVAHALAGGEGEVAGEVRVTSPEAIASALLAPHLGQLAVEHPRLRIELVTGSPALGLIRRETDIALRYDDTGHGDFTRNDSFSIAFGVYATPDYVARHGVPEAIDRFEGHRLITFDDSPGHVAPGRWHVRGGRGASVVFRSNSVYSRVAAANAGIGCTLLPAVLGDAVAGLVRLLDPSQVGALELFLFTNRRVHEHPRIGIVSGFLSALLRGQGA